MVYIPVAMAVGLVVGLAAGGSLHNLARASFRWWLLLAAGVAVQLFAELRSDRSVALVLASYACLLGFALRNATIPGMTLIAIGTALNALVIGVNGGMPVKPEAIVAAGIVDTVAETEGLDFGGKRHLANREDRLVLLADVLPVPIAGGEVLSYGDLVLALGSVVVVARLIRPRRRSSQKCPIDAVNHRSHSLNSRNSPTDRAVEQDGGIRSLKIEQRKGHQGLVARPEQSEAL